MNRWMNCNPIYVANRDDGEVEALIADYKKNASPDFNPTMIHIKTPEQVVELEPPGVYSIRWSYSSIELTRRFLPFRSLYRQRRSRLPSSLRWREERACHH